MLQFGNKIEGNNYAGNESHEEGLRREYAEELGYNIWLEKFIQTFLRLRRIYE